MEDRTMEFPKLWKGLLFSSKYVEEHCSYDVVSKEMELTVTNHREKPIDMLSYKPKNN